MRIGFFGGSFDPPHSGHLAVARAARARFGLSEVLLAPTGRQPLKPGGAHAPFADRLTMLGLLCRGEAGLEPSALDAPRPGAQPNYTADTLEALHRTLPPGADLFCLLGADAFLTLPQWHRFPELFRLAEWIVVSRPGYELARIDSMPLSPAQRARTHRLSDLADPTSATAIRAALGAGQPCEPLLPPALCAYVRAHGLYGMQPR